MAISDEFRQIEAEVTQLRPLLVRLSEETKADYLCLANAFNDWATVCRRYEGSIQAYQELNGRMAKAFEGKSAGEIVKFEESQTQFLQITGEVTIDICCFYIFAVIARRALESLMLRISRKHVPDLEEQFAREFEVPQRWFEQHVVFYRDCFIEHSQSLPRANTVGYSPQGAQLGHMRQKGLMMPDVEQLGKWREELKGQFPELGAVAGWNAYDWICDNLERLPDEYLRKAKQMIRRVGNLSDPPEKIMPRLAEMFAAFVRFIRLKTDLHFTASSGI